MNNAVRMFEPPAGTRRLLALKVTLAELATSGTGQGLCGTTDPDANVSAVPAGSCEIARRTAFFPAFVTLMVWRELKCAVSFRRR